MPFGLEVGLFIGALQADEFGQRRGVAAFQAERGVSGVTALLLAGVVISSA